MIHLRLVRKGPWTIYALAEGTNCRALKYIEDLEESDKKKIIALLDHTAENGPPRNPEKFKKVDGSIFEFKAFQHRLLCFFHGKGVIILTHGVRKKQYRHDPADIARAERLRKAFLESKGG